MKSCQEITYLASNIADRPMTTGEKIELHWHLMICKHCRKFYQNNQKLSIILQEQNKESTLTATQAIHQPQGG